MSSYCPHCNKYINHRLKCKKYTQEVQDKYDRETRERKEAENKLRINIKKVKEEYPDVWEYFETKIRNLRHERDRHRERHSCESDSSEF